MTEKTTMEAAEKLTVEQRTRAKRDAILSACWGSISAAMISDSAIIILFATILGAGDMLSMVTTSLGGMSHCFLLMPAAFLSSRLGHKKAIMQATSIGVFMILLLAAAPLCGVWARHVMLFAIVAFSICMTVYVSAWFPLIDSFLIKEDRGSFLGVMRFSWQTFAVIFFFVCGLVIGKNPEMWMLQIIIVFSALGLVGRVYYTGKVPYGHQEKEDIRFGESVSEALSNKPLAGFSVYICCLYLAAFSTSPLMFIYMKKALLVADNVLVIISSLALTGTVLGFLSAGKLIDRLGTKRMLLFIHFSFALINFSLFFVNSSSLPSLVLIAILLAAYGFFMACSSITISAEMMELASPNNKSMSMAFCGSCFAAGSGGSRLLTSLILGSGMLAPQWFIGAIKISHYQTLFLIYGCAIFFVCLLLVLVPSVFPRGNYRYMPQ